ncbi:MAG: hypothetical protein HY420_02605 [Candidatus Kerfeldbacteria bacterium]|nr:hypothetical protein [Candidatus Kerfeldbacteria bacterium]
MSKRKSRKRPSKAAKRPLRSMRGTGLARYIEVKRLVRQIPPEVVKQIIQEELDRI